MNVNEGLKKVAKVIIDEYRKKGRNLIVGVSGPVACGKTRFVKSLIKAVKEMDDNITIVQMPFDYWINKDNLSKNGYAERFFLEDLKNAVRCISEQKIWMCPRFDLVRKGIRNGEGLRESVGEKISWSNRMFSPLEDGQVTDTPFGSGVFKEDATGRLFSLVKPLKEDVCIIDGTMVFATPEIRSSYSIKIFIDGLWACRVSRMIRRHNRKEVFGASDGDERSYVGFLVDEALGCADKEILEQKSSDMITLSSTVDSISNLLDLFMLRERLCEDSGIGKAYFLKDQFLDSAISDTLKEFSSSGTERKNKLLNELESVAESKHLIKIANLDTIIKTINKSLSN